MKSQGQTWVRLVVLGQSFMLHQIRKMVGAALAVMRGTAPPDAIPLALSPARQLVRPFHPLLMPLLHVSRPHTAGLSAPGPALLPVCPAWP